MTETLIASENMIYTDGNGVYGKVIRLADGVDAQDFYEIPEEQYNAILEEQEQEQNSLI